MSSYPRKLDYRANVDETAPYFIERNKDCNAFRCCNRYYEVLSSSPEQSPWFQIYPTTWLMLTNLCNEKNGWHLQGKRVYLYRYTESEILSSTGYKIIPIIEKQIRLLSQCLHNEYRLEYFDYAIGKSN